MKRKNRAPRVSSFAVENRQKLPSLRQKKRRKHYFVFTSFTERHLAAGKTTTSSTALARHCPKASLRSSWRVFQA
eukprot:1732515-Pleurochrysis_carterae.AAC.1